ncbi:hypothetical protein IWZ03DRAFT_184656 [Phyllosticta citriasiana]|uniref:Uncharacterized protein n=1 Tax=Phyllosticta citriasiana TaxID=595635 RepID=A0ABR1KN83_9PEZI
MLTLFMMNSSQFFSFSNPSATCHHPSPNTTTLSHAFTLLLAHALFSLAFSIMMTNALVFSQPVLAFSESLGRDSDPLARQLYHKHHHHHHNHLFSLAFFFSRGPVRHTALQEDEEGEEAVTTSTSSISCHLQHREQAQMGGTAWHGTSTGRQARG